MELTREENRMSQGIAILAMLMLHLFCQMGELPYRPIIWLGDTPLVYYLGLFGDLCVPVYCFCSGYGQILLYERENVEYGRNRFFRMLKLLLNYWTVLFLFSGVGLLFDQSGAIPGSLEKFLGNLFLYNMSYNGAWWYVLTYFFLVLASPLMIHILKTVPGIFVFIGSGVFYFIAYVFRFAVHIEMPGTVMQWCWEQMLLFGTSQFSFVVGMLFYEKRVMQTLRNLPLSKPMKNGLAVLLPLVMFGVHCVERSLIIAPITGLVTMVCFHLFDKPQWLCKGMEFMGRHSTNIWLVHMFYYLFLFKDLVYCAAYPLFIYLLMVVLCLATSWLIDRIYMPLVRIVVQRV